jgi:hypothetical protein
MSFDDNDAEKLRTLARWFDIQDAEKAIASGRIQSSEVQNDLRRIADVIDRHTKE